MSGNKYIVVKNGPKIPISEIVADCSLDICVPTKPGESLESILKKICNNSGNANGNVNIEAGENILIDGNGSKNSPYIISAKSSIDSIGLQMPSGFTVANSPITNTGTFVVSSTLDGIVRSVNGGFTTTGIGQGLEFKNGILSSTLKAGTGLELNGNTFSHGNTSNVTNVETSALTVIGSLIFDESGHVTGWTTRELEISTQDDIYTDEKAQDAIGNILIDTESISFIYNDSLNQIFAHVSDSYVENIADARIDLQKGEANGLAPLTVDSKIPKQHLIPLKISVVDNLLLRDSIVPESSGDFVKVQNAGNNIPKNYIWNGEQWIELADNIGITSVNGKTTSSIVLNTGDLAENGNLFFTNERVDDRVAALLKAGENVTITYNDIANTVTISSKTYTDANVINVLKTILQGNSSIEIIDNTDVANNPAITFGVKDQYIFNLLKKQQIKFTAGTAQYPAGTTTFKVKDCNGQVITNKKLNFFRERFLEIEDDDYTYDRLTGDIVLTRALKSGERCVLQFEDERVWNLCDFEGEILSIEFSPEFSSEFN